MKSLETDDHEERQQRLAKQKTKNLIPQAEKTCKYQFHFRVIFSSCLLVEFQINS